MGMILRHSNRRTRRRRSLEDIDSTRLAGPRHGHPGTHPSQASCDLKQSVVPQGVTRLTCKLKPADRLAVGTYTFDAVFLCGSHVIDNWDPEIVIEPSP